MKHYTGSQLLKKISKIELDDTDNRDKLLQYFEVIKFLFNEIASNENVQLSSLFSQIAYAGNKFKINKQVLFHLHSFRKNIQDEENLDQEQVDNWTDRIHSTLEILISELSGIRYKRELLQAYFNKYALPQVYKQQKRILNMEVHVFSCDIQAQKLAAATNAPPFQKITIQYGVFHKNENFSKAIIELYKIGGFPISMQLLDVEIDEQGCWIPSGFVISPSFLVDVTTIAECFKGMNTEIRFSILQMLLPLRSSKYLVIGHLANHLLDSLLSNPEMSFSEFRSEIFQLNPLNFSLYNDDLVKEVLQTINRHFRNLKKTVNKDFIPNGIHKSNVYIEPSFLSPEYGIQGRLDVLHLNLTEQKASIIELKSGKAFRPNTYGLSNNHYVQTLLYDLLVKSVLGKRLRLNNFILYSGEASNHLRYAPTIKTQQWEAIRVRNEIFIEYLKLESVDSVQQLISTRLKPDAFKNLSGFNKTNVSFFAKVIKNLDALSQVYFCHFIAFISKERRLSKTGYQDSDRRRGFAGIWNHSLEEKIADFSILNHLEITKNLSDQKTPEVIFLKSMLTSKLNNFREGDIAILYPDLGKQHSVLKSQVFKCMLISQSDQEVNIRLRSQQHNFKIFKDIKYWHLEHDVLDSSFNAMYRGVFEFASAPEETRNKWLGQLAPKKYELKQVHPYPEMTEDQGRILREMVSSEDYYLLWGPPGTGKTSVMVHRIVSHLLNHTIENILIVGYTNRAVDEICEAIVKIGHHLSDTLIRIGSKYATKSQFRRNLLDNKLAQCKSRKDVIHLLQQSRIIVGTISSVVGKHELFGLMKFDRLIVDEASQILEPTLVGLLCRFKKVVLIGDHKQLPAVCAQSRESAKLVHAELRDIGLMNLSDSLFERLFKRCIDQKWHWAYGQLHDQGRMHNELMQFPNKMFYNGKLRVLGKLSALNSPYNYASENTIEQLIGNHRKLFFPTGKDFEDAIFKTHGTEAKAVEYLIFSLQHWMLKHKLPFSKNSIGVITPYRAQIAKIRSTLNEGRITEPDLVSVDTVERYQGGARDRIIISFCINQTKQLDSLISLSEDGVDRKLNVALTRAREQLILLGNEQILSANETYKHLIDSCVRSDYFIKMFQGIPNNL